MNLTIEDCAEALSRLRKSFGIHYNPSEKEIIEEAKKVKTKNHEELKSHNCKGVSQ